VNHDDLDLHRHSLLAAGAAGAGAVALGVTASSVAQAATAWTASWATDADTQQVHAADHPVDSRGESVATPSGGEA
jgi:hypothetical protein